MTRPCRILVTGAAGTLGRKLCFGLARAGRLGARRIELLAMTDLAAMTTPPAAACPVETLRADLTAPGVAARLVALRPDVVLHLAATLEGVAAARFDVGYAINFDAARALFEAIRVAAPPSPPRVVSASSIAVFGGPAPDPVPEDFSAQPHSSYGAQKAMTELLLADYVRKGFLDGVAPRLATIAVRPGPPGRGASAFFSTLVAEPLRGRPANVPVGLDIAHWLASPRVAVAQLIHAATMETKPLGARRALTMPGVCVTLAEMVAALRRVGGAAAAGLLSHHVDPALDRLYRDAPARFDARRARALGFPADADIDAILRAYVEDDLAGAAGA